MKTWHAFWDESRNRTASAWWRAGLLVSIVVFCSASLVAAGTLSGTVKNATTNRPATGAEVVLMELKSGMNPVAKTKTDAKGHFHFSSPALGQSPTLLQVPYGGAVYYQSVKAGATSATILVYNTTSDPKALLVASHAIIMRPNGQTLQVEEQFVVQNQTKPPVAFHPTRKPSFEFQLPDGAQHFRIQASAENGLPTLQKTTELGNHRQGIDWAFRPGKSLIRLGYVLPYSAGKTTLHTASPYPLTHVFLAVPPGIALTSDGFSRLGNQQGYDVYARQSVAANADLTISLSGMPAASAESAAPSGETGGTSSEQVPVATLPGRIHNLTWILAGLLAVLLFFLTMFLLRKSSSQPATAGGPATQPGRAAARREATGFDPSRQSTDTRVQDRLEQIKEELLQLEIRHQAGKVSTEDYGRERHRIEQVLRDFLRD